MSKVVKLSHLTDQLAFDGDLLFHLQKISKFRHFETLEDALGITEGQANRLVVGLTESLLDNLQSAIQERLLHDEAIEFPKQFVLQVKQSKVLVDEQGVPKKRLTVRLRKALKAQIQGGTD